MHDQYERILGGLAQMRSSATQIINHERYAEISRSTSLGQVMRLLAENRFRDLRQSISQGRQVLSDLPFLHARVDLEAILNTLEHRLYSGSLNSFDDVASVIEGIHAADQLVTGAMGASGVSAPVRAFTLIRSQVDADGEVVVHGPGAEQTTVKARGRVQIANLRDTHVKSETAIDIGLAAASEPDNILLEVSPGGQIRVGLAVNQVWLQVGAWRHQISARAQNVYVQSQQDGRVTITPGQPGEIGQALLPALANGAYHPLHKG